MARVASEHLRRALAQEKTNLTMARDDLATARADLAITKADLPWRRKERGRGSDG